MSKSESSEIWDYIIIGGGISGLSIGALLSHDNQKVLILEKDKVIGGRAKTIEKDGFLLDNGLHLLKYGWSSSLNEIFRLFKGEDYKRLQIHPIRNYHMYAGEEIKHIKPSFKDKRQLKWWNRGWISVPRNMNEIRRHNYFSAWELMKIFTTGFKCRYADIRDVNLKDFIKDKGFKEIPSRYMKLAAGALLHTPESDVVSAGEVIRNIKWSSKQPVLFGYPSGSWKTVIEKLREEVLVTGEILTDHKVSEIILEERDVHDEEKYQSDEGLQTEEKKKDQQKHNSTSLSPAAEEQISPPYAAKGVKTEEQTFYGRNIIIALAANQIPSLFKRNDLICINKDLIANIKNFVPASGISFDIALKKKIYGGRSFLYTENPSGYGIFLSNLDPTIAPEGKQLFSAVFIVNSQEIMDLPTIRRKIKEFRAFLMERFPKMEENILFERKVIHHFIDSVQINTFQYKDSRPGPKDLGVENLYLTGDYLNSFGSGGELCFNSVWETYNQIKEDLKNRKRPTLTAYF